MDKKKGTIIFHVLLTFLKTPCFTNSLTASEDVLGIPQRSYYLSRQKLYEGHCG